MNNWIIRRVRAYYPEQNIFRGGERMREDLWRQLVKDGRDCLTELLAHISFVGEQLSE